MGSRLEDLLGFVIERRAEKVQVFNKVEASKVDDKWEHIFAVTASVEFGGTTERFRFEVEKIVADHALTEQKKEDTPEYVNFPALNVSHGQHYRTAIAAN